MWHHKHQLKLGGQIRDTSENFPVECPVLPKDFHIQPIKLFCLPHPMASIRSNAHTPVVENLGFLGAWSAFPRHSTTIPSWTNHPPPPRHPWGGAILTILQNYCGHKSIVGAK